jgi:hypothetical protein
MPPYVETAQYLTRIRRRFRRLPEPAVRTVAVEAETTAPAPVLD